ncbi:MAG: U-box domain-containing protein (plasmid) [Candidatus Algichlamydia australiensis]|nr:U-box domain-containing protein [Chlamydiales bacterium]
MSVKDVNRDSQIDFEPFQDPISHEEMKKAVVLPCGHSFSEKTITVWIVQKGNKTCPNCQIEVDRSDIKPNYALRDAIESMQEYVKKQISKALKVESKVIKKEYRIVIDFWKLYKRIEESKRKVFTEDFLEHRHLVLHKLLRSKDLNAKILIELMSSNELLQKDGLGNTPLHLATKFSDKQTIESIFGKTGLENLGIRNDAGQTPLLGGLANQNILNSSNYLTILNEISLDYLLVRDVHGKNYMHYVCQFVHDLKTFLQFLEKATPEILGATDKNNQTPLHHAINGSHNVDEIADRICQKMLEKDLNKVYEKRQNYLHYILQTQHHRLISVLLRYMNEKAKKQRDDTGKMPIEYCILKCSQPNAHTNQKTIYFQYLEHLIYKPVPAPIAEQIEPLEVGEKVEHILNRRFGVGEILGSKFTMVSEESEYGDIIYEVVFPKKGGLTLHIHESDIVKAK